MPFRREIAPSWVEAFEPGELVSFVDPSGSAHERRDSGWTAPGAIVVGAALIGGAILLARAIPDINVNANVPGIDVGDLSPTKVDPVQADVAVDQQSQSGEALMKISCLMRASGGVDVDSFANGAIGDGHWKTKYFLDYSYCGDSEIGLFNVTTVDDQTMDMSSFVFEPESFTVPIDEVVDPITNQVTQVNVMVPGLEINRPRPNALDDRNCLGTDTYKASMDEVNEMLAEYQAAKATGEAECENGFYIGGIGVGAKASRAITFGQAAAQYAFLFDVNPPEQIEEANARYIADIQAYLKQNPRYQNAVPNIIINDQINGSQASQILAEERRQATQFFKSVETEVDDDGNRVLKLTGYGGDEATVTLTGNTSGLLVDTLIFESLNEETGATTP